MSTKDQIINNLREYSAADIADAIRSGEITMYELSKSGKLTPLLRRRVEEQLKAPAKEPQAEESKVEVTTITANENIPQPVQQPVAQPEPQPVTQPISQPQPPQPPTPIQQSAHTVQNVQVEPPKPAEPEQSYAPAEQPIVQEPVHVPAQPPVYVPPVQQSQNERENIYEEDDDDDVIDNRGMWKRPFSFHGRIRRSEYGVSYIISCLAYGAMAVISSYSENLAILLVLPYIALIWFMLAQGAKRCHDLGQCGWFQIIPFYFFVLGFADGQKMVNKYGNNPKQVLYKVKK
jgi:uncharacterized membrane protein YhaH (DUF805 family)